MSELLTASGLALIQDILDRADSRVDAGPHDSRAARGGHSKLMDQSPQGVEKHPVLSL
jgi:hypothetical protein